MKKIKSYLELLRVRHYIKNLLIFAPLFFKGDFLIINSLTKGIFLFIAFSLLASSVYIINDICDKEKDQKHPIKKNRPIANGRIKEKEAIVIAIILIILTVSLSLNFPIKTQLILIAYFILNLLYSLWLKKLVIIDIFVIASMYIMRIYAGSKLWELIPSHWIILCTFFLSLFLISAKRRAEFNTIRKPDETSRAVIEDYNKDFLDHLLTITSTSCIVTYSLYVISIDKPYLLYSLFFVTFGIVRYLYLVYTQNSGESPEQIILKDKYIILVSIGYIIYNALIFY